MPALKPGHPSDKTTGIGPLISLQHRDKVMSYYRRAMDDGATLICGGGIPPMPKSLEGGAWISADDLDGSAGQLGGRARGNLWSLLPYPAVRLGRGSRPPGE